MSNLSRRLCRRGGGGVGMLVHVNNLLNIGLKILILCDHVRTWVMCLEILYTCVNLNFVNL